MARPPTIRHLLAPEFLAEAARRGVSADQVEGWREEGLLLRPQGRGRHARYPVEALTQLDALLDLRRRWRTDSPARLRLVLWCEGFRVPAIRLRDDLVTIAAGALAEVAKLHDVPQETLQVDTETALMKMRLRPELVPITAYNLATYLSTGSPPLPRRDEEGSSYEGLGRRAGIPGAEVYEAMAAMNPEAVLTAAATITEHELDEAQEVIRLVCAGPAGQRLLRPRRYAAVAMEQIAGMVFAVLFAMRCPALVMQHGVHPGAARDLLEAMRHD